MYVYEDDNKLISEFLAHGTRKELSFIFYEL